MINESSSVRHSGTPTWKWPMAFYLLLPLGLGRHRTEFEILLQPISITVRCLSFLPTVSMEKHPFKNLNKTSTSPKKLLIQPWAIFHLRKRAKIFRKFKESFMPFDYYRKVADLPFLNNSRQLLLRELVFIFSQY